MTQKKAVEATTAQKKETTTKTTASTRTRKKQFKNDTPVLCRSVTYGDLTYVGVNNMRYDWGGYGDIRELPYQDVISLRSRKSDFLYNPWIIIEDEDIMAKPEFERDFKEMYELYADFETAEDFFDCNPAEMKERLQGAPEGFKQLILGSATSLIRDGVLDSIGMINVIDEVLGTNLKMLID